MPPGYWYFIALGLVVLPLVPFSAAAAIIAAVWVAGQGAFYGANIESAWFDLGTNALALMAALYIAYKDWAQRRTLIVLALSFVVMIAVNAADILGHVSAHDAWWSILILALGQSAIVPFNADWRAIREGFAAIRDLSWIERLMRVAA